MNIRETKPRILVFASGTKDSGGSGFREMVEYASTDPPVLDAKIVGVVSNYPRGGVWTWAHVLEIPFEYWPGPFAAEGYQYFYQKYRADFVMCSGWLKPVRGLDPARTINIHPGPLDYENPAKHFGGPGMYGRHVHEAVIKAFQKMDMGEGFIFQSAVTMHFVTGEYDRGPIFFQRPVIIRPDDTAETLAKRVNEVERAWQSTVLNWVVHKHIRLKNGKVEYSTPVLEKLCMGRISSDVDMMF